MNKIAIRNFAIWARKKLREEIITRAGFLGITEMGIQQPLEASSSEIQYFDIGADKPVSIRGREIQQRKNLADKLSSEAKKSDYKRAYDQLIETTASDWFNRLVAIRYMEVNEYAPLDVRLLSSVEEGKQDPDLVTSPFDGSLEFSEAESQQIIEWKAENDTDKLFRYLFIKMCNELYQILPGIFEREGDYSEILMRLSFIDKEGVIYHLIHDIAEEDWKDQVQIIGWIYQYYNTELKDETFALLKKNVKITKERIPSATQLFTPDWIVRYMVENSLGRLWIEGHQEDKKRFLPTESEQDAYIAGNRNPDDIKWHHYLEEAPQEPEVEAQLDEVRAEYAKLDPEDITCIDPCMGSGHILVYMFDVLMQIYVSKGYSQREAAKSILEHNLYGLDIDERAYQLAYFAVMMKARKYNRRILTSGIKPHIYAIVESNDIDPNAVEYFCNGDSALKEAIDTIFEEMYDAKEYGSILNVTAQDWRKIYARLDEVQEDISMYRNIVLEQLLPVVRIAEILGKKYWVVCTNPPYMSASGMNLRLSGFIKKNYSEYKSDFFSVFVVRASQMVCQNGYCGFFTPYVWMFIQSYEKMRRYLYEQMTIETLIQLEYSAFEEATVPVCTFTFRNRCIHKKSVFLRLVDFRGGMEVQCQKVIEAMLNHDCGYYFERNIDEFSKLPGATTAYWISDSVIKDFQHSVKVEDISETRIGMATANNDRFMRLWHEVSLYKFSFSCASREEAMLSRKKWFTYCKGGSYRKWYGNLEYVVNWENDGQEIQNFRDEKTGRVRSHNYNLDYIFKPGLTFTAISSSNFACRTMEKSLFGSGGSGICRVLEQYRLPLLGFLNSKIAEYLLACLSLTMNFEVNTVGGIPFMVKENCTSISNVVRYSIALSKSDWDSFETSWNFKKHPLLTYACFSPQQIQQEQANGFQVMNGMADAYRSWERTCEERFIQLKCNEEEINRIFIDIYGLQDELTPEVDDKDITVRKADLQRDIRSFLSYAVGCMFGRYSLDIDGLAYAGGEWDAGKYSSFIPDPDNVIPLTDRKYSEDDIVERLSEFLKIIYGEETLEENLDFIASALKGKGISSREIIRNYFLNDFFKDHCKIYQKRPIYWMFDSGKEKGFKALVYMHRWDENTTARVELYLQEIQKKYETEIRAIDAMLDHITDHRQAAAEEKRREHLRKQVTEIREYDECLEHMANEHVDIDLDDGVKKNYEKVQTDRQGMKYQILAKIK